MASAEPPDSPINEPHNISINYQVHPYHYPEAENKCPYKTFLFFFNKPYKKNTMG